MKMKYCIVRILLTFLVIMLAGCNDKTGSETDNSTQQADIDTTDVRNDSTPDISEVGYLVKVENQHLPAEEFLTSYSRSKEYRYGDPITIDQITAHINFVFLNRLLFREEAHRQNLLKEPEASETFARMKKRILTRDKQMVHEALLPEISVSEEETREFYEQRKEEVKIAHIRVSSEYLADSLYAELDNGANFEQFVKSYSRDFYTVGRGGLIDAFFTIGDREEAIEKAAFSLKKGEIAPPVETFSGYHIIKLVDRQPHTPVPFSEISDKLQNELLNRKKAANIRLYEENLFNRYDVEIEKTAIPVILNAFQMKNGKTSLSKENIGVIQLDQAALRYNGGEWDIDTFINVYNETPTRYRIPLKTTEDIRRFVKHVVIEDLYYLEAIDKKLDQNPQYLEKVNKASDDYIVNLYRLQYIEPFIKISEEELKAYYETHKSKFGKKSYNKLKEELFEKVRSQKYRQRIYLLRDELLAKYNVEYNTEAIEDLLKIINQNRIAS